MIDPRVLRAMAAPVIGQFDPAFTAIMDEVMELARQTFLTANERCFPVSGLAAAGLEALFNTLLEPGDTVSIGGGPGFVAETADLARRYGAEVVPIDSATARLVVTPMVDADTGQGANVQELATTAHARGARLILEATQVLGACELRVDDWDIDACVAGVDHAVGAPSGMALVTYSPDVEALMQARTRAPKTSYLDLLQLQAYWSPERLNHHTAPTSLVFGLHEALRLILEEGLTTRWARHRRVGQALRAGLEALGLDVSGDPPYAIVRLPAGLDETVARQSLRETFGVHVKRVAPDTWAMGFLGAEAHLDGTLRVLSAVEAVMHPSRAVAAARAAV